MKNFLKTFPKYKGWLLLALLVGIGILIGMRAKGGCINPADFNNKESKVYKKFSVMAAPNDYFNVESAIITPSGCMTYGVIRTTANAKKPRVYGVMYDWNIRKMFKEKKRYEAMSACAVSPSSKNYRVEYFCYDPKKAETAASYAYDGLKRKSYIASCHLSTTKELQTCSSWIETKLK